MASLTPSHEYLFFFGRTPELSKIELMALYPQAQVTEITHDIVSVTMSQTPEACLAVLGGTVKIAKALEAIDTLSAENLSSVILSTHPQGRVEFGISVYGTAHIDRDLLSDIKKELLAQGTESRFVEAKHGEIVSSVAVQKNDLLELNVIGLPKGYLVTQTVGIQPFESWSKRDYSRPHADAKGGMLPPKIARMIGNIALGSEATGKTLLDPFCGMGTVLAEALLRGARVIGSDLSSARVEKAKKNIAWLQETYKDVQVDARFYVADAVHISEFVFPESVDCIVTEPFMGSTEFGGSAHKATVLKDVKNTVRGLEKLYIGCLKNWHKVLKPEGKIVIALPEYDTGKTKYFVKRVIDSCEILGYTTVVGPIEYSRPQAVVRRKFYILQKLASKT